jgi:hypothetical protein
MLRYAELVRSGGGERERIELLRNHRLHVRARLAELTADLALIDHKIANYERNLKNQVIAAATSQEEAS